MNAKSVWLRLISASCAVCAIGFAWAQPDPQAGPPPDGFQGGPGQFNQRGPGGPIMMRRPFTPMVLLHMTTVQKELDLSDEQIDKINKFRPMQGMQGPGGPQGPADPGPRNPGQRGQGGPPQGEPGGQRDRGFQGGPPQGGPGGPGFGGPQGQQGGQGMPGDPAAKMIKDVLNDKQEARLKELVLQFEGITSWMRPDVGRQLDLNEDQRQSIDEIIRELMPPRGGMQGGPDGPPPGGFGQGGPGQGAPGGRGGARQGGQRGGQQGGGPDGPPPGGFGQGGPGGPGPGGPGMGGQQIPFDEMLKIRAQALRRGLAVLDSDQRATWDKMTGKTFNKWEAPRRPPMRQGGEEEFQA